MVVSCVFYLGRCGFPSLFFGHCQCGGGRAGSQPCAGDGPTVPRFSPCPVNPVQKMHSLPSVFLLFQLCHPKLDDACSHLLHLVVCGIMPTQLCAALGEQQAGFLFSFERVFFPSTGRLREVGACWMSSSQPCQVDSPCLCSPGVVGELPVCHRARDAASWDSVLRCHGRCTPLWQHSTIWHFITSFNFCGYILNQGYFY